MLLEGDHQRPWKGGRGAPQAASSSFGKDLAARGDRGVVRRLRGMSPALVRFPGLGAAAPDALPLIARIGRAFRTGAHVTRVAFLGDTLAAALGDGDGALRRP